MGPGRGSAAGSLVSYAMEITDIDPLQYGLLFERFLNPERISMPDIDIDFCMNRRGEVIQYVTEKYGREQVAQIITFDTLGARAAIKDVGRVLDMPFARRGAHHEAGAERPEHQAEGGDRRRSPASTRRAKKDPRVDEVLEVALRLEGLARNCSVHAAGVVISPQPLKELVPLYKTNRDEIVTQYDMSGLEKLALLKMDFLGLTTLTLIEDALKLIEKRHGVELVPEDLPLDDPATYEIFCKGFTSGVFQFESPGMRDILRRYQPSRIEDLTRAERALPSRPDSGRHGGRLHRAQARAASAVQYDLPELKELLEETYGVIVYQEQVMQISNRIAGYSLGDADLLRRAMGKKKLEEMAKQRERFVKGALERGFPQKKVEKIFDLMEQFAGYGFNKSHSAAYAYLAFVTAYLKAHYPVEFMAALLTSETGNTAKVVKYINECREMGITVLPPDVNASDWSFTPGRRGDPLRPGRGQEPGPVGGGGDRARRARRSGAFTSLYEFCEKVDLGAVNRRMIESLIHAGAMDSLEGTRARSSPRWKARWKPGSARGAIARAARWACSANCWQRKSRTRAAAAECARLDRQGEAGRRKGAARLLGHRPSARPLRGQDLRAGHARHRAIWKVWRRTPRWRSAACSPASRGSAIKEGKPWAAMQLEDRTGSVEAMVLRHATTSAWRPQVVEDTGGAGARPGAAGRERGAEDLGAGHRGAG